jgi:DNA-binding NarL/FixJ family response regulator
MTNIDDRLVRPALSPRQRQCLNLLVQGRTRPEIAAALGVSLGTVKVHCSAVLRRCNVRRSAALALAVVGVTP